jgi:hypothetical protein
LRGDALPHHNPKRPHVCSTTGSVARNQWQLLVKTYLQISKLLNKKNLNHQIARNKDYYGMTRKRV